MDYAPFPLIDLSGNPRERGRQHGQAVLLRPQPAVAQQLHLRAKSFAAVLEVAAEQRVLHRPVAAGHAQQQAAAAEAVCLGGFKAVLMRRLFCLLLPLIDSARYRGFLTGNPFRAFELDSCRHDGKDIRPCRR